MRQLAHLPYRRVLIPVDFSAWSAPAFRLARQIAPEATLVLLHAVGIEFEGHLRLANVGEPAIGAYRDEAMRSAYARLSALAEEARLAPERWSAIAAHGVDPWMLIARHEQEDDCDLIVVGKHGRHALEELLLGSTTQQVIAEAAGDVPIATRTQPRHD